MTTPAVERVHTATRSNARHTVSVSAEQFDGQWTAKITVDGVLLAHESIGPVDEVHPPEPTITKL